MMSEVDIDINSNQVTSSRELYKLRHNYQGTVKGNYICNLTNLSNSAITDDGVQVR